MRRATRLLDRLATVLVLAVVMLAIAPGAGATVVGVAKVSRSASKVPGCKSLTGTVTLTAAAPAGGASVTLASSAPSAAVPAGVTVAGGALTATFPIKTTPVAEPVVATITAALNGSSKSTTLTVRPIGVASVIVMPTKVAGGETAWGRAQLECKAGPGPVAVDLASLNATVATPTSGRIWVPTGKSDGYFALRASDSSIDTSVVLTARASAGSTRSVALAVGPTPATTGLAGYRRPEHQALFDPLNVPQASGLAHSVRNPGWVYVANDGPITAAWAVRETDGAMVRLPFEAFVGTDVEDLAVAPCSAGAPASCLYVGDIGDNSLKRSSISVLRITEPDLSTYAGEPLAGTAISLNYPSLKSRNAEALLVGANGVPYVVTKDAGADKTGAAKLYGPTAFSSQIMTSFGKVPVPVPTSPWTGKANLVTGGDVRDGRVVLRTFDHAVEYRGAPGQPLSTFATWPKTEVPIAREAKGEAISYRPGGCGYLTASEHVGDLWSVACEG